MLCTQPATTESKMQTLNRFTIALAACLAISGCATAPNLAASKGAQFAHADLQNAAAIATKNGYPARAAVWLAIDTQLMACENALSAAAPVAPSGTIGLASGLEVAAEGVGTGIPAAVQLNCAAIPIPSGFLLPIK
jgi:hypothetical protein